MAETMDILIVVKTYPIPSKKYDELVCTAGVTKDGEFVRLYPINFRDLDPSSEQYQKYQWINVEVEKHGGRDTRKESYRPVHGTLRPQRRIPTEGDPGWAERARYALAKKSRSMEELWDKKKEDRTSLGVFRPQEVRDLVVTPEDPEWDESFLAALRQKRLWEYRKKTLRPPRKVPFKFQYVFRCNDDRCNGHRMMITDWELGALFWKLVDGGGSYDQAAQKVKQKYLDEMCGPDRDTHFFVGTVLGHGTWLVIGVFWPKKPGPRTAPLFEM